MGRMATVSAILGLLVAITGYSRVDAAPLVPPGYEGAASNIPTGHLALVSSFVVERRGSGQSNRRTLIVRLPIGGKPGELYHEVGHIVMWSHPDLERAWIERFWPGGTIVGAPSTSYGRENPGEDWAESYQQYMEDGKVTDPKRHAFMRDHVFRSLPLYQADVAAPSPSHVRPATISACTRPDVPSGSVVPGCRG